MSNQIPTLEDVIPNPADLIKSIAEQGYSLKAALADLIDNCISAKASEVEILINQDSEPYKLFLADNGYGMSEETLKAAMRFPSTSSDIHRENKDLGRFGLGLKTASFSQTRKFTILSREHTKNEFQARTWDLEVLQKEGTWSLVVNTQEEINELLEEYKEMTNSFLNSFEDFEAKTIVVWHGLHKFEDYIESKHRTTALNTEITETISEHLSLVFHRFMEKKDSPLSLRVNNLQLDAFNPFPSEQSDVRPIQFKERAFANDKISIEGFVLPSRAVEESLESGNRWVTKHMGLIDMEGIYIYRAERIISFGGWNDLIKKVPRLQLARLRVEIGNQVDHLLHLNVAKSQVVIPYDLRPGFERYVYDLKNEAIREFHNRGLKKFPLSNKKNTDSLFTKVSTNKGVILELNNDFPMLDALISKLNQAELSQLKLLIKMINTGINKIRQNHSSKSFVGIEVQDGVSIDDLMFGIKELKLNGFSSEYILKNVLLKLGYKKETLPSELFGLLKEGEK